MSILVKISSKRSLTSPHLTPRHRDGVENGQTSSNLRMKKVRFKEKIIKKFESEVEIFRDRKSKKIPDRKILRSKILKIYC